MQMQTFTIVITSIYIGKLFKQVMHEMVNKGVTTICQINLSIKKYKNPVKTQKEELNRLHSTATNLIRQHCEHKESLAYWKLIRKIREEAATCCNKYPKPGANDIDMHRVVLIEIALLICVQAKNYT